MASGSDDDSDQGYSDFGEEDELQELDSDNEISSAKYHVLTEDAVRVIQEDCIATVADLTLLTPAFAALVLRHCSWSAQVVQDRWFSDEQRVRDAIGLPSSGDPVVALKRNDAPLTCDLCFDEHSPGQMRSAGCAHFYCLECWRGYLGAAAEDGARCLSLRCPDTSCSSAVVRDLVHDVVADDEDVMRRYDRFSLRSFVEESKRMRWCPSPGCALAVDREQGSEQLDVVCSCGHGFCIVCAEEPHRPVPCATVRKWMAKNSSESETTNWVLANAKHCPKCRRPIEKNTGCNHMTCASPCGFEFCWLCLGPWQEHSAGIYNCNRFRYQDVDGADLRREQARASLDRYLHYFERWSAHETSRQRAREDMFELESTLAACGGAGAADEARTQVGFLMDAYAQILHGRRMLRWTYAYGFYADGAKLNLLECLQGEAEAALERLHAHAEVERNSAEMYFDGGVSYFKNLAKLTKLAANYFDSMAEAFQTDLA